MKYHWGFASEQVLMPKISCRKGLLFPNIARERQGYEDISDSFISDEYDRKEEGRDSEILNLMTKLCVS